MNTKSFPKLKTLHYNQEIQKLSSGGAPTPAGTSVFTKHNWDVGMEYLWLNGWVGYLWLKWVGHLWLTGVGIYDLMSGAFIT